MVNCPLWVEVKSLILIDSFERSNIRSQTPRQKVLTTNTEIVIGVGQPCLKHIGETTVRVKPYRVLLLQFCLPHLVRWPLEPQKDVLEPLGCIVLKSPDSHIVHTDDFRISSPWFC